MNTNKDEFLNKQKLISKKVLEELELSKKYYQKNLDDSFDLEDYYTKFVLFTIYRGIEDLIDLLLEERKINSISKDYYPIFIQYIKSNFIDRNLLNVIINELSSLETITYNDVYEKIKNSELSHANIEINSVSKILPTKYNKNSEVDIDRFLANFSECRANRNKLLHSVIKSLDLTKNTVISAMFVYAYLLLIIENILN